MSDLPKPGLAGEPSGLWYDWTKNQEPERPWVRDYSRSLVVKIFLAEKAPSGLCTKRIYLDFEGALAVIRRIDALSPGVPKIAYLVGWQYFGHDSCYPAWDRVNQDLRAPGDADALDSLRRVIRDARDFDTAASLHVNMIDATPTSPLWREYLEADVVIKDEGGKPVPGEIFSGEQSFQLSYHREWELGLAQRRIDGLLAMIPELAESGTLHIDAFHSIQPRRYKEIRRCVGRGGLGAWLESTSNPFLGTTLGQEIEAQRKVLRLFRDRGLDVTAECGMYWLRLDPFVGLQPMAWHFHPAEFRRRDWIGKPRDFRGLPASLYCGAPFQAERAIMRDPERIPGLERALYRFRY